MRIAQIHKPPVGQYIKKGRVSNAVHSAFDTCCEQALALPKMSLERASRVLSINGTEIIEKGNFGPPPFG